MAKKNKQATQWFVETFGRRQAFTNEKLFEIIRDTAGNQDCAFGFYRGVVVTGSSGLRHLENLSLCSVPNHNVITALRGIRGTEFREFRRIGGGKIEQVNFTLLEEEKKKHAQTPKPRVSKAI